jgi:hypothetical protein
MTHTIESYAALAFSVPGASHLRSGLPNQDAFAIKQGDGRFIPVVLSVADGHGSARCPRSDRGSKFGVDAALAAFLAHLPSDARDLDATRKIVHEKVIPAAVTAWRRAVEQDLLFDPLKPQNASTPAVPAASASTSPAACPASDAGEKFTERCPPNYLAYGSTLLVAAAYPNLWVFMQLGDGDILLVDDAGVVTAALPDDPTLMADQTTSLCQIDCEQKFRVAVLARSEADPALVQLSTDGYANSFQSRAGFEKTGPDTLNLLYEHGRAMLDENMEQWLRETTESGSGDDVTVGFLFRSGPRRTSSKPAPTAKGSSNLEPTSRTEIRQ